MTTREHGYPLPTLVEESEINPTSEVSSRVRGAICQMETHVWHYENLGWDEEQQEWRWNKPNRSPQRFNRFRWGAKYREESPPPLGTLYEAMEAFEHNDLEGVGLLVEPERTTEIRGRVEEAARW